MCAMGRQSLSFGKWIKLGLRVSLVFPSVQRYFNETHANRKFYLVLFARCLIVIFCMMLLRAPRHRCSSRRSGKSAPLRPRSIRFGLMFEFDLFCIFDICKTRVLFEVFGGRKTSTFFLFKSVVDCGSKQCSLIETHRKTTFLG